MHIKIHVAKHAIIQTVNLSMQSVDSQIRILFMNVEYQPYKLCPLIEAKTDAAAYRACVQICLTVWNVETSQVHEFPAIIHAHIISVADVCTKSHRPRPANELFRLDVDKLVNGDEACPSSGRQRDVLG